MIEISKSLGNDENFCFGVLEHEQEFALAENRHQWIENGPDARTGKIQQGEVPPVRQLHGHDVVAANAEPGQSDRNSVGKRLHLSIRKAPHLTRLDTDGSQRQFVGTFCKTGVQVVVDSAIVPVPSRNTLRAAGRQKNGVKLHFPLPSFETCIDHAGTAARPARVRAMMVFMICAVPSPIWKPSTSRSRCSMTPRS